MSCGTDTSMLRLIVQDVVSQLLKAGTLQGGLLDCNDKPLPAQRTVVQCKDLVDTVVTKFERSDRKLRITLSDNTEFEVEIPELAIHGTARAGLNQVRLTRLGTQALMDTVILSGICDGELYHFYHIGVYALQLGERRFT